MFRSIVAAGVLLAGLTTGAFAAGGEADRAEFKDYVKTCSEEHKTSADIAACISDQVGALENYLGDILSESEGIVGDKNVPALRAAQTAWEAYRDTSCAYHEALNAKDADRRSTLCRLRLVKERIEEILEGQGFADADAKPE